MAGGDFILGGLLSGLGKGQEMDYTQKRQEALDNLRNQRSIEAEDRAWGRQKEGYSIQATNAEVLEGVKQESAIQKLRVGGEETRKNQADKYTYDVSIKRIEGEEERRNISLRGAQAVNLEKLKADLDMRRDEASQRLRAKIAADERAGTLGSVEVDKNGRIIIVSKDMSTYATDFIAREKVDTSNPYQRQQADSSSYSTPEGRREAPRGGSNDCSQTPWYQVYPGNEGTAQGGVFSVADVRKAARDMGISEGEARRRLIAAGNRIE